MEALLAAPLVVFVLFVLLGIAGQFGVDSRDGFGDDRLRQPFR